MRYLQRINKTLKLHLFVKLTVNARNSIAILPRGQNISMRQIQYLSNGCKRFLEALIARVLKI